MTGGRHAPLREGVLMAVTGVEHPSSVCRVAEYTHGHVSKGIGMSVPLLSRRSEAVPLARSVKPV